MDLEKLQELADKDLKINETELDLESLRLPQLHNKYMKHLTKFKLLLSKAEAELATTKRYYGSIILARQTLRFMQRSLLILNY